MESEVSLIEPKVSAWGSGGIPSRLLRILVLALVYVLMARLGLRLALLNPSATALWPPTGISIAAALLFGYGVWPGVWLGAFIANLLVDGSVGTSIGIATGNTAEALIAAWLVFRYAGGRRVFTQAGRIFRYLLIAGVATMVSATVGAASLLLSASLEWHGPFAVW